tara:strand:+ start:1484 stop:1693 length:210 start_codon:yes stop_codon:yes gene_type:complete
MSETKYKSFEAIIGDSRFVIEEDKPEIGWYLYVYQNGVCTHDYLQDSLAIAKKQAQDQFSVPLEEWKEI